MMGICGSKDSPEDIVSHNIDKLIEQDAKRTAKDCKILLLGASVHSPTHPH